MLVPHENLSSFCQFCRFHLKLCIILIKLCFKECKMLLGPGALYPYLLLQEVSQTQNIGRLVLQDVLKAGCHSCRLNNTVLVTLDVLQSENHLTVIFPRFTCHTVLPLEVKRLKSGSLQASEIETLSERKLINGVVCSLLNWW